MDLSEERSSVAKMIESAVIEDDQTAHEALREWKVVNTHVEELKSLCDGRSGGS